MITSIIEMLELSNFDQMTTFTVQIESLDKILLLTSCTEIMTSKPLFQNTSILRKPRVAIDANIIKIVSMFTKTIFKNSKEVKKRNYISKCNAYSVFLDIAKFADFW